MAHSGMLTPACMSFFLIAGCSPEPVTPEADVTPPAARDSAQSAVVSPTAQASAQARDAEQEKLCAEKHAKPYPAIAATDSGARLVATARPSTSASSSSVPAPSASVASVEGPNAGQVVAAMAPLFRRCYQKGIACDREMKGSLRIEAKVAADGTVASSRAVLSTGLSQGVIDCVAEAVKSGKFAPPEGGGATIVIPVSYVPQP